MGAHLGVQLYLSLRFSLRRVLALSNEADASESSVVDY
jgi:hypothetical protein